MAFDPDHILNWTFPIPRLGLVPTRVHWTVLLLLLFDLSGLATGRSYLMAGDPWPLWLLPAALPLFWLAHWIHELGHAGAARLVGAKRLSTALHMLIGGIADLRLPVRPWPLMAYAGGGILFSLALGGAAAAGGVLMPDDPSWWIPRALCSYLTYVSLRQAVFNLFIPIHPFDGGLLLRGLLWPILGIRRAVTGTLITAYVVVGLIFIGSIIGQEMLLLVLGISLLFALAREHRSVREGYDPWLGGDPRFLGSNQAVWSNWSQRRAQARDERLAKQAEEQGALLDRLLDKVSTQGLPSLTAKERAQLERIAKNRKREQDSG